MSNQKTKSVSEDGTIFRNRTNSVKVKERNASKKDIMSTETREFIQKFCYKETASIDMTQHGFINDSKVNPFKYMMKPLREQLAKICVKPAVEKRCQYSHVSPQTILRDAVTRTERKLPLAPKKVNFVVANRGHYAHDVPPLPKLRKAVSATKPKPLLVSKSAILPTAPKRCRYSRVLPQAKLRRAVTPTHRKPLLVPKSVNFVVANHGHYARIPPQPQRREAVTPTKPIPLLVPKSALRNPRNHKPRSRCRRVSIQSDPSPGPGARKKVLKVDDW